MSERIYLDLNEDGVPFESKDWQVMEGPVLRHLPTSTMWRIGITDGVARNDVGLEDFYAELVHFCEAKYKPDAGLSPESMVFIGRGAIIVLLQDMGIYNPKIVRKPDRPEQSAMRREWKKNLRKPRR
jgi:hypothetical protein